MGGIQSGTHNLGDALWVQERQKQKCHRDGREAHGPQPGCSTQERRKLLKRTRSLAVISEDESCDPSVGDPRLGSSCDSSPYGSSSSPQHRRPQLIPRAKLIDRNSLKDRLCKSQQHLTDCYERFSEASPRPCQSRSVCGLYSLPAPLAPFPEPLSYARGGGRPVAEPPDRLNILKWPDSPRHYRSVQDLNTVTGLVDIVEDSYWPAEENRSVDCIYTQVKRKRKEHRSLDSILFEDDSDELEYFDVLNLLPLSNVRLECDESDKSSNDNVTRDAIVKEPVKLEPKTNPTVISVSTKRNYHGLVERCSQPCRITEIVENVSVGGEESVPVKLKNREPPSAVKSSDESNVTSFSELAREKRQCEGSAYSFDNNNLDLIKKKDNLRPKVIIESCQAKVKPRTLEREQEPRAQRSEAIPESGVERKVEETEESKSLWISDNEETEEMSRRPQVLKIIDNDVTKVNLKKSFDLDNKSATDDASFKENYCDNTMANYLTFKVSNKPDLINDHVHETKDDNEACKDKERLSVVNARSFFEKKTTDTEPLTNRQGEGRFERIVKETSCILGKACNAVKGSLGFEARSESSDLGLGSDIGSDVRRLSVDENTNTMNERIREKKQVNNSLKYNEVNEKNQKNFTNLTRSKSCVDSLECQDSDEPEFDHVRYKIVKSNVFSKNIFNNAKKDVSYDGLMQYLREYSFQDLLMDNNVVIIEPVRAEVERKSSFNDPKLKTTQSCRRSTNSLEKIKSSDLSNSEKNSDMKTENHFIKTPRQSSLRKHFFYQPIRVNRELNDDELPDPDTVRNVRKMFEESMKKKLKSNTGITRDCSTRKSVSMKDLTTIETPSLEYGSEKPSVASRSRCSSRAKDLTKMFENLEKTSSNASTAGGKEDPDSPRQESKARTIAQSFEARSGHTSPSNSNSSKSRVNRYQRQVANWDAGSVSSGVSSDYPDTDAGSAPPCTSSEDEDLYCQDDDGVDERYEGHYVSQDVLKKIREYGTSVTYYGGKVINTCNGPMICPMVCKNTKGSKNALDYVKFRLVKSNSCDSRLELTGRVVDTRAKNRPAKDRGIDLRQFTIDETPSIEITTIDHADDKEGKENVQAKEEKREPPVVIGLEPKREEGKTFKADFKLGKMDDSASMSRFAPSALTRWQMNENAWKRNTEFGKMEFEEFEVLEDSLNGPDN